MAHHIFQLENELQNILEAAPKASRSFSVSEKLARYDSSALSGMEHLRLLVADAEHALWAHLDNPEAIYRANLDMKGFHQEVVRVVLLDAQNPLLMCLRWVSSALRFLLPDCQGQRTVHV